MKVEDVEPKDVYASAFISELKRGAWKKQLTEMTDGTYLVEVYWFPWLFEPDRPERWEKSFKNEKKAWEVYNSLTSMRKVKKILKQVR